METTILFVLVMATPSGTGFIHQYNVTDGEENGEVCG